MSVNFGFFTAFTFFPMVFVVASRLRERMSRHFGLLAAFAFFPMIFVVASRLRERVSCFFRLGSTACGSTLFPMLFGVLFPFTVNVFGKFAVFLSAFFANRFFNASRGPAAMLTFFAHAYAFAIAVLAAVVARREKRYACEQRNRHNDCR